MKKCASCSAPLTYWWLVSSAPLDPFFGICPKCKTKLAGNRVVIGLSVGFILALVAVALLGATLGPSNKADPKGWLIYNGLALLAIIGIAFLFPLLALRFGRFMLPKDPNAWWMGPRARLLYIPIVALAIAVVMLADRLAEG